MVTVLLEKGDDKKSTVIYKTPAGAENIISFYVPKAHLPTPYPAKIEVTITPK